MKTHEELAATVAATVFGVHGSARRLDGESDLNYLIESGAGERHVLKLHHPATDLAVLDMQNQVLLHLASGLAGAAVPAPVETTPGTRVAHAVWVDGLRPVRLLTWISGSPWTTADATPARLEDLGARLGTLDRALADFTHAAEGRSDLLWRITAAKEVAAHVEEVRDEIRDLVRPVFDRHVTEVEPALDALPHQVIHHDVNENNIILGPDGTVWGFIDFGDVARVPRITELAVACAYALQGFSDPADAIVPLVAGYHRTNPLQADELEVLVPLVQLRLATSITMSAHQFARSPGNEYLLISQAGVEAALASLAGTDADILRSRVRDPLGFEAVPAARTIRQYFESGRARPAPMIAAVDRLAADLGHPYGATTASDPGSVHVDRGIPVLPGAAVSAPLDVTVVAVGKDEVMLRHRSDDGIELCLAVSGLDLGDAPPAVGTTVHAGTLLGHAAPAPAPAWAVDEFPHGVVRVQFHTLPAHGGSGFVPAVPAVEFDLWRSVHPDPNLLVGDRRPARKRPVREDRGLIRRRRTNFSPALGLSYADPVRVVRGEGAHLFDRGGNRWLDLVNNVCHVGHCHPRVVAAATDQAKVLNTNTRYLHESMVEYARRLIELFPDPLHVCFFVNSGSEANDLALRLARAHTGRRDVLVLDHAYHGNLTSQIDLSPYKFNRAGGLGQPSGTWVCELPDMYRGRLRDLPPTAQGVAYAGSVAEQLHSIRGISRGPAALFVESLQSCGGQIVLPPGYLQEAFALARAEGAVTVADEIQVGLGRVGSHVWGFETQGVVPDIVTLGKPLGNGYPLAAVVTTPEIARSFETGMEWFNTFGGNPVAAEVGLAVLDVLRDERLQANAVDRGAELMAGLTRASVSHPLVGDVRGQGLFIGIELSQEDRVPAPAHARALKEAVKRRGAMVSTDGPDDNVIKIKPPMVLTREDCAWFVGVFEEALAEVEETLG